MPKRPVKSSASVEISVVTPAFNEAQNLPLLYTRLKKSLDVITKRWEWIVVDDHSADNTYQVMEPIARKDKRVKVLRFAKNSGSHLALACALREAKGKCAVGIAADLQDPPEIIKELYARWKDGAKVVWAARAGREGETFTTIFFARLYYFIVRYFVGIKQLPPTGADFFLLDRVVLQRLAGSKVRNASILLLICSFGLRQDAITYIKRQRAFGKSGWSLRKKFKLFFDSVTMFSEAPIYWALSLGSALGLLGAWSAFNMGSGIAMLFCGSSLILVGSVTFGLGLFLLNRSHSREEEPLFRMEKRSDSKKTGKSRD